MCYVDIDHCGIYDFVNLIIGIWSYFLGSINKAKRSTEALLFSQKTITD